MKNFEYIKPNNLDEVVSILRAYDNALLLAGGTDLLIEMKNNFQKPQHIIDLKGISNIQSFNNKDEWHFGALTKIRDIEISEVLQQRMPFLCQAASCLGSIQIRNRATIGGYICNAAPSADTPPPLICLDAKVIVASQSGIRIIPLVSFFKGPGETDLKSNEIFVEVQIPNPPDQSAGCYSPGKCDCHRSRWNYPAYRCLPGGSRRAKGHLPGYSGP